MIIIDKHIKNALHQCLGADSNIRQSTIVKATGIQQSSISRWISGITTHMGDDNWFKIFPYIKKYLPDDYEPKDTRGNKKIFTINHNYKSHNTNSHNGNHFNTKDLEKDPFESILLEDFRNIKNKADKIKTLAFVQEIVEKQNQED